MCKMRKDERQETETLKNDSNREDRCVGKTNGQAGEAREVMIWEKGPATRDGGQSQGESTVRAVPLGEGTNKGRPPVIVIVSSGFGAGSRSAAPLRMTGKRMDSGLRMAA
ncbi:hypothetical protein COLU111180_09445 [Cohnella lubricantis]|uniref:Uncharacterized protein n=1 Tax=Cohnella lubricantis TaxID=2163172 RepID=A0A841T7U3_9BACL|nr:hypothetical protein [Cohnella lubricantis]MBB6676982.1 hypothetical protein [Cohnella lubricantis]MBP2118387.1 hypothetical protein [Cohnella lubricantis]